MRLRRQGFFVLGILSVVLCATSARAAARVRERPRVPPSQITSPVPQSVPRSITIDPKDVTLVGARARQALIVTGQFSDGSWRDLTRVAKFRSLHPHIAQVSAEGVVTPTGDGVATIKAWVPGNKTSSIQVAVKDAQMNPSVSFVNEVVPVLSKAGCNMGACHGAQYGKGGFKLSLFGYDPLPDYDAIVKFGEGRRIARSQPEKSLILLKPLAVVPHGGGVRFAKNSVEYDTLLRWVAAGCPTVSANEPRVAELEIIPSQRLFIAPQQQQQLLVRAHFSDGSVRDVTHLARYDSLDDGVAVVNPQGRVTAVAPGEAPIVARFQGIAVIARMTVPTQFPLPRLNFPPARNYIDRLVFAKLAKLGIMPSELSSDEEFLRRVSLDITGTLPQPDEIRAFLTSADSPWTEGREKRALPLTQEEEEKVFEKRAKKIDELLERKAYVDLWTYRWGDLLRLNSQTLAPQGVKAFYDFIRQSVQENKPWDQFCAEMITAEGHTFQNGPVNYYRAAAQNNDNAVRAIATAQTILGVRIECAQCHKHPFEAWTQDDFHGFAAIFARVRQTGNNQQGFTYVNAQTGTHVNPRTGRPIAPKLIDGPAIPSGVDPRVALARWLSLPDNPYFAKAIVNRVWKYFFGRGLVEPVDDLRSTNPASNEELLDALAKDFIAHRFDLKHLIRTICNSRTYQLSCQTNASNKQDTKYLSRAVPRRLSAEQLLDAISDATGVPENFNVPNFGRLTRAIELPDSRVPSYFLDVFGRPKRVTVCECERSEEVNIAQALHMISGTVNQKLSHPNGRLARLLRRNLTDEQIIEEMYLATLSRFPRAEEIQAIKQDLAQSKLSKREALEDWFWALMDSKGFLFNH
ncbi:MAG: DUF1553 domain-containing protein [Abditibacteriales bacterium]|nr:DUF1553 domain-containing protein [Abditibacteriales bacterium]MDW8366570.1 DUF1553 domain-containing protein [Abditibacteriales bacterium]